MATRLMTLIIASLLSGSVLAMDDKRDEAQQKAESKDKLPAFANADANDDGILTWKEAKDVGISKETFERGDYDDNGEISQTIYEYSLKS